MTIKSRIALGIAALLAVLALVGGAAVLFFERIAEVTTEVVDKDFEQMSLTESLLSDVQRLEIELVTGMSQPEESFQESVVRFAERLDYSIDTLLGDEATTVDRSIGLELRDDVAKLRQISTVDTNALERLQVAIARLDRISVRLQSIYENHQHSVRQQLRESRALSETALETLTLLVAISVAFSLAVLVWLPRYVAAPIARFAKSIDRIASGQFRTRLPIERGDEFGKLAASFNAMAERLEAGSDESQAAVLASRERLKNLVDELDDMILGMDAERRIVFINAAMARYLDLDPASALGSYMPDLALGRPRIQQLFQPIALGESAAIEPFTVDMPDSGTRYLQERVVRAQPTGGAEEGDYIILLSDVTDYEVGRQGQSDYLATLSHEMKTPIAAIDMSISLLEDPRLGSLDDEQRELTHTVRHNADRLRRMINEVLALSKSEAGATALALEQVDIRDLLEATRQNVNAQLRDRQIHLAVVNTAGSYRLEVDPTRITWVLDNLLTNAIRYSPLGGTVTVACSEVTGGVRVEVCDQGPGVRPEDRERIFGRYTRAREDNTAGTGLGLAISREYVDAHGGRLFLDTTFSPGACFVLELPRRLSAPLRQRAIEAQA